MRSTGHHNSIRQGVTLLEAVLALGLMVVLLGGVYSFYFTAMKARETGKQYARDVMTARSILATIALEVRQAVDITPGDGQGFQGDKDSITIVTTRIPERYAFHDIDSMQEELPPGQADWMRITYQLLWPEDEEDALLDENDEPICYGLWRTIERTIDPNPSFVIELDEEEAGETWEEAEDTRPRVEGELIAPEIKYLEFEYYDGADWHDRWHVAAEVAEGEQGFDEGFSDFMGDEFGGDGEESDNYTLPQMVRITMGYTAIPRDEDEFDVTVLEDFEDEREGRVYHEDRYTIQVALRTADPTQLSSRRFGASSETDELEVGGE